MGRSSGASSFPGKEDAFSLRGSPRQAARINIFFFLFLSIGIGVVCGLNALVVSRSFFGCFPSRRMSPSPTACPVCGCAPYSKMIISYLFSKINLFSAVCTTIAGANHLQICNRPVRHSRRLHERRRGANLATRAALPLAGGFEPPLPGAVETEGWPKPNPTKYSPRHNANPGQHIADPGEFSFCRREEA